MINVNDIKKGDKFDIITNGSVAEIMTVEHKEDGTVDGFMIKVQPEEYEEFIAPMSAEFYNERIERFRKI